MELLREKGKALSTEQLNACLNDIMRDLTIAKDANNQQEFIKLLLSVIQMLTPIETAINYCDHPAIVNFLLDRFLDLLRKDIDETIEHALTGLADFFQQCRTPFLTTNNDTTQTLIDALVMYLTRKVTTFNFVWYNSGSPPLIEKSLDRLLHTLLRTLENRKNENSTITWLEVLIDCVCSSTFVHTFRSLHSKEDNLTTDEELLLINCVIQVYNYNDMKTVTYLMQKIASCMLSDYIQLLLEFIPPRKSTHVKVLNHFIHMLQFLAIDNDIRHQFVNDHALVIDSLLTILNDDFLWNQISDTDTEGLFDNATNYFFLLSLESDLLPIMKTKPNVTKCMLRLTEAKDDATQFNAYRTLAIIMTEDELKRLTKPDKITAVFLKYMNYTIDLIQQRRRLENLLFCLKSRCIAVLVRHIQRLYFSML
jgi:hypothetical protein